MRERTITEILEERETLQEWIQKHGAELWNLTEIATDKPAYDTGRRNPLLLARTSEGEMYLLSSKPGKGKKDTLHVWMWPSNLPLGGTEAPTGDYVTINVPRAHMGRPRRKLAEEEKAKILELRAKDTPINQIAKKIKCSNRLVMGVLRENQQEKP